MCDEAVDAGADIDVLSRAIPKYLSCRPEVLLKVVPAGKTRGLVAVGQDGEGIFDPQAKLGFRIQPLIPDPVRDEHCDAREALEEYRRVKSGYVTLLLAERTNTDPPRQLRAFAAGLSPSQIGANKRRSLQFTVTVCH
jgi:hypothetical protein